MRDLAEEPAYSDIRKRLTDLLIPNLYGSDLEWLDGDQLVGVPEPEGEPYIDPPRGTSITKEDGNSGSASRVDA